MLPEEIKTILNKYSNEITEEISNINQLIEKIVHELLAINSILIDNQTSYSKNGDIENKNKELELLNDSFVLREYIRKINRNTNDIDKSNLYDKVYINITNDNLCPKCNVHLENHQINYKIKNIPKNVWWYKCPCCNQIYCIESEVENFDFSNTNIVLNYCFDYSETFYLIFTDIIVLSTIKACTYKNHNLREVLADIPVFKENGEIDFLQKSISYCPQCNRYIMLKSDFKQIENIVACQIIDETVTRENRKSDEIEIKQYESILYRYGYNVKSKENISNKQRHLILSSVVESGILTRQQICSHLDTLIERGSKIPKWKEATQKWKQDREYVKSYNPENLPEVLANRIIAKYSQM